MRSLLSLIIGVSVALMACSTPPENVSLKVSETILASDSMDKTMMCSLVSQLDSMLTPEIFGRDFAVTVVNAIENDSVIDAKELNRRVEMLRKCLIDKKGTRHSQLFAEGVQSYVNGLSIERQMALYVKIATPEQLGTALRIDRYRNESDSAEVQQRADVLKTIYNEAEYSAFLKYYNR